MKKNLNQLYRRNKTESKKIPLETNPADETLHQEIPSSCQETKQNKKQRNPMTHEVQMTAQRNDARSANDSEAQ
jgi:hypothetical protein